MDCRVNPRNRCGDCSPGNDERILGATMMAEEAKSRLGRGLAALIGDAGEESALVERVRAQRRVPVEFLRPNPRNPRQDFGEAELEALASSIRERGIIQPILVRSVSGAPDAYEIIAGERRWRAAQRAGLHEVPIVPIEASDREALEFALIENVQRTDLNPLEEAAGYRRLAEEFEYATEDIARIVGKSRPHVANTMRLLALPPAVQAFLRDGRITAGHARTLLGEDDPFALAEEIVKKGLNVRQVEARAQRTGGARPRKARSSAPAAKHPDVKRLEDELEIALGLTVSIDHRADHSGTLEIRYRTLEQLDMLADKLFAGTAMEEFGDPQAARARITDGTATAKDYECVRRDDEKQREIAAAVASVEAAVAAEEAVMPPSLREASQRLREGKAEPGDSAAVAAYRRERERAAEEAGADAESGAASDDQGPRARRL
jgi:ParB family transcriptional regulator, chromosome partitioning protein